MTNFNKSGPTQILLPVATSKVRPITALSSQELKNIINNYNKRGVTIGGPYDLRSTVIEVLRREGGEYCGEKITALILQLVRESHDSKVGYAEFWHAMTGGEAFVGKHTVNNVMSMLAASLAYCLTMGLPLVTAAVVTTKARTHSKHAVMNIYSPIKAIWPFIQERPFDFVKRQAAETLALALWNVRPVN